MKPESWEQLTATEKVAAADKFFATLRGQYIIGQCLVLGVRALRRRGEESNAQDAEMLQGLFSLGVAAEQTHDAANIARRRFVRSKAKGEES